MVITTLINTTWSVAMSSVVMEMIKVGYNKNDDNR